MNASHTTRHEAQTDQWFAWADLHLGCDHGRSLVALKDCDERAAYDEDRTRETAATIRA